MPNFKISELGTDNAEQLLKLMRERQTNGSDQVSTKTIYVSIGNSDDKLTQNEWSHFYTETDGQLRGYAHVVHGAWESSPTSQWQNACWCIEIEANRIRQVRMPNDHRDVRTEDILREKLSMLAHRWGQDSIAWAEATTEFIGPAAVPS